MQYETIVSEVRRRLIATGATQTEIAKATGLAQSSVGRFLRGESDPNIATFYGIVRFVQECEIREILLPERSAKGKKATYVPRIAQDGVA